MAYIKRAVEDTIARVSKMFPVLLVTGPRQVGKTTLLQRMAEAQQCEGVERKYVTLDDPDVRYLAKRDPALFLQRYSPPVLIDEIQYATELLPYIKMSVDRSKRRFLDHRAAGFPSHEKCQRKFGRTGRNRESAGIIRCGNIPRTERALSNRSRASDGAFVCKKKKRLE